MIGKKRQAIIIFNRNKFISFKFFIIYFLIFIYVNIGYRNIISNFISMTSSEKCYISPSDTNLKIIHLIITRFMIEFWPFGNFKEKIYKKDYILNGIRCMKKYLLPSLDNQSCKKFIWILKLGEKANITYIKSLLNFKTSFEKVVIYEKDIKTYIKNKTIHADILITTRIDYDDRIYYDAVNDVRKAINPNKPLILFGYNRGVQYYEFNKKYYELIRDYKDSGVMSIFISLIVDLNKVNNTINIFDLGTHIGVRKTLLSITKYIGIKTLNYEPAIWDSGDVKIVWVRQNYSGLFHHSLEVEKSLKPYKFNLNKFYGK